MFNFFDTLFEYLKLFFDIITNIFKSLFILIQTLFISSNTINLIIEYAPPILSTSCIIVFLVTVLNYIVGRSNQS